MTVVELHLDEMVLQRARQLAESHGYTLEEVFALGIEQLETVAVDDDSLLGLFADEPDSISFVRGGGQLAAGPLGAISIATLRNRNSAAL